MRQPAAPPRQRRADRARRPAPAGQPGDAPIERGGAVRTRGGRDPQRGIPGDERGARDAQRGADGERRGASGRQRGPRRTNRGAAACRRSPSRSRSRRREEEHNRLQSVLASLGDAVVAVDHEGERSRRTRPTTGSSAGRTPRSSPRTSPACRSLGRDRPQQRAARGERFRMEFAVSDPTASGAGSRR